MILFLLCFRRSGLSNRVLGKYMLLTDRFNFKNLICGSVTLRILFGPSIYRLIGLSGHEVMRLVQISPTSNLRGVRVRTHPQRSDRAL